MYQVWHCQFGVSTLPLFHAYPSFVLYVDSHEATVNAWTAPTPGHSLDSVQRIPSACFLEVPETRHHHALSATGLNMKG